MRRIKFFANICVLVCMGIFLSECDRPSHSEPVAINRLDVDIWKWNGLNVSERDSLLCRYRQALSLLLNATTGSGDVNDSVISEYSRSKAVRVFEPDILQRIKSIDSIESVLGKIDYSLKSLMPGQSLPDMYGCVIPYNQRIISTDSVMLIGLNHYLGSDYAGYMGFPAYQRRNKNVSRLPYDVTTARLAALYPMQIKADHTTLEHILYNGALYEAVKELIPEATDADVLGYDQEQMQWALNHEADIWKKIIGNELLYSTVPSVADRMLNEAPSTPLIHPDAPGGIGKFIGMRIVQNYRQHNKHTTPTFLLSPDFYSELSTLAKSGYSPR